MDLEKVGNELPLDPPVNKTEERRLWIGNLDPRVTEYQLLKLMQKYGAIEKFDLLFHRTGPQAGQPRGYAFVTFADISDANVAKTLLHNKLVGTKNIVVTWAHSMSGEEAEKLKPQINIPALAIAKSEKKVNRESQIQAIEAKLKLMERKSSNDLEINKTIVAEPPVLAFCQGKRQESSSINVQHSRHGSRKYDRRNAPYGKAKSRR